MKAIAVAGLALLLGVNMGSFGSCPDPMFTRHLFEMFFEAGLLLGLLVDLVLPGFLTDFLAGGSGGRNG